MSADTILETAGKIAGIGGLSLGVFLLLFRDLIRKLVFRRFTQEQPFRLFRLVAFLVWMLAIAGLIAWTYTARLSSKRSERDHLRDAVPWVSTVSELEGEVARFAGAAEALQKTPNYSDAMSACRASRLASLMLFEVKRRGLDTPDGLETRLDQVFQQAMSALRTNESVLHARDMYESISNRYDYFRLLRDKGPAGITPRMEEVAKEL